MDIWTVKCDCQERPFLTCDRERAAEVAVHHVTHCGESHVTAWVQLSLDALLAGADR